MAFIRGSRERITISARAGKSCSYIAAALILVTTSMMAGQAAHAADLNKVSAFNIEAQTLDKALLEFGAQAHVQIMFAWNLSTARLRTHALKGNYTGKEALARILKGTRLRYVAHGHALEILPQALTDPMPPARAQKSLGVRRDAESVNSNNPIPTSSDSPITNGIAQTGESPQTLGEVVVTAQKYRQLAFDVPISLEVISGQELQRLNISNLNDLQYDVAGLYVEGGNVSNYIVLRGVSNLEGNGSLVGEYIDEADISAEGYAGQFGYGTGDVELYDLERVEVLKGPQGTLYGDGSMGGVIRYITNKPALSENELSADVSTMFTEYGAPSERTSVMLNTPVVEGTVGLRIAGQFQHDGGWVDEPVANLKNINSVDLSDVRIEALWQPTAQFKALATDVIHRETYGIGAGEDAQGDVTPAFDATLRPQGEQSSNLYNLTLTEDFSAAQLLSSSTYLTHAETDQNESYIESGVDALESYFPVWNKTLSEELRLHSMSIDRWQWTLGGFYKHYRDYNGGAEYFGAPGPLSTASYFYALGNTEESDSEAVFVDTSFRLLERLTLGAGVRYFQSRYSAMSEGDLLDNAPLVQPTGAEEHFVSTDPRFDIQYRLTPHINTYASAAKGFRSGEPNLGLFLGFNPESLWSYDLGTKMRFLQGRLSSDTDVFYEAYSDYVGEGLITVLGVPIYGDFNIGDARIKGLDMDVAWRVSDLWRLSVKGEVVSSKFSSITAGDTGFLAGERVPFVPSYTVVGSVERDFTWGEKPGFSQVNYSQTARVQGYSSPVIDSDVIRFLSFRTGIRWNRNLRLALFAQNLLNDRGYLDPYWNEAAAYRPRPRTLGMDFAVTFD